MWVIVGIFITMGHLVSATPGNVFASRSVCVANLPIARERAVEQKMDVQQLQCVEIKKGREA